MDSFEDASRDFLAWLSISGADISNKIQLQDLREQQVGRGVVATQDIEEDELLFRIPRSAVLSVENCILSHDIPKATFDHLGPWLSLIFVMLYEYVNQEASNWAPYFAVLPNEFNTLMFWEPEELEELQASAVRNKIGKQSADEDFKKELVPVIKEFAELFFAGDDRAKERAQAMAGPQYLNLMHRMGSLIMAYAFDIEAVENKKDVDEDGYASEDEDEALPKGMVPMADMLNADADRNNARLFYEQTFLSMKALKPIKAGEEIFNDYGPLPRSDLLRRYGYITDNYAKYDVVEIPHDLVSKVIAEDHGNALASLDSLFPERFEYLDEQGLIDTGYDITTTDPFDLLESIAPELIVMVETFLLHDADFDRLKRKGKLPKPDQISARGADTLLKMVNARIAQYSTSLEDDLRETIAVPLGGPYTSRERRFAMAKLVRIGEKKILRDVKEALSKVIQELNKPQTIGAKRFAAEADSARDKRQRT